MPFSTDRLARCSGFHLSPFNLWSLQHVGPCKFAVGAGQSLWTCACASFSPGQQYACGAGAVRVGESGPWQHPEAQAVRAPFLGQLGPSAKVDSVLAYRVSPGKGCINSLQCQCLSLISTSEEGFVVLCGR